MAIVDRKWSALCDAGPGPGPKERYFDPGFRWALMHGVLLHEEVAVTRGAETEPLELPDDLEQHVGLINVAHTRLASNAPHKVWLAGATEPGEAFT